VTRWSDYSSSSVRPPLGPASPCLPLPPVAKAHAHGLVVPCARLVQAGHEVILQVEGDERCAAVLRQKFPRARLLKSVGKLLELPADTEVLAAALPWPESDDDDVKGERAVREHPWLPASRAAAVQEHAHVFRLLAGRPVSWVVLELPVSLLRWATSAVPGGDASEEKVRKATPMRLSTRRALNRKRPCHCALPLSP